MNTFKTVRLAYLVSQYPSVTHTFILREIRALRELGFEVDVISVRPPDRVVDKLSQVEADEYSKTFTLLNCSIYEIFTAHVLTFLRRPASYLVGFGRALRLARGALPKTFSNLAYFAEAIVAGHHMGRLGLNHVHSHFSSTVALFIAYVFPITFSATIHGPDEFNDVAGFYMAEKAANAKFLCAISNYSLSQLMKASKSKHWNKLRVCPLGVDGTVFVPRVHGQSAERVELLCVGRLAPAKAQLFLLGAVDRLVRAGRPICMRLIGDGPDREALRCAIDERGLQNNVVLEGACSQDQVLGFYHRADIFVLASFAEGVPVVLMEAMSMEIPCVATWVNGVPELIRHGVDGWLVPPADEVQLASAIALVIDDPGLQRRLGKSARQRVLDNYDLTCNTRRLAETYHAFLS
jgi:colanic acid/amylovoran biosynthesis glycosyltransferase